jgi:hypothetical protein
LVFAPTSAECGNAVFSADGGKVFIADDTKPILTVVNIDKRTTVALDLTEEVAGRRIIGLDRSRVGFLLCLTDLALWAYDLAEGHCVPVCHPPAGCKLTEFAYEPTSRTILLCTDAEERRNRYFLLPSNEDALVPFATARWQVSEICQPVFRGRDLFLTDGNGARVWACRVSIDMMRDELLGDIEGYCMLPLEPAVLMNSRFGNTTGADQMAVAGDFLYFISSAFKYERRLRRARIPAAPPLEPFDYETVHRAAGRALQSLEEVESFDKVEVSALCSSPDGARVLLVFEPYSLETTDETLPPQYWLIENHRRPKKIVIRQSGE